MQRVYKIAYDEQPPKKECSKECQPKVNPSYFEHQLQG